MFRPMTIGLWACLLNSIIFPIGVTKRAVGQQPAPSAANAATSAPSTDGADVGDESEATGQLTAEELAAIGGDLSFAPYFDSQLLNSAVESLDASLLTDAALKLSEGERVLLRPRRGISSKQLFRLAANVAAANRDKDSMQRIQRAVGALDDKDLKDYLGNLLVLASQSRASDPLMQVFSKEAEGETDAALKDLLHEIEVARLTGDTARLDALSGKLGELTLPQADKDQLTKILQKAREEMKSAGAVDPAILEALSSGARASYTLATVQGALNGLAKQYIIKHLGTYPMSDSNNWGNQLEKKIWNPIKFKHEKIHKNHGLWTKWDIALDSPSDNLFFEVRSLRIKSKDTIAFQAYVRARARGKFEAEEWSWGQKLGSARFEARVDVKVWVDIEVTITPLAGTTFRISSTSPSADIKYENLVFDKVGKFGGATAELLGRVIESAFRGWFSKKYQAIRDDARTALRQACVKERDIYIPIKRVLGI